ncbi:MDR family oxidoreductase [Arcanobacterium bovis]|uniref:Oxidoreductase n=1 Tax=Arcanobacterium bovis TaxID=2529275 RepID=A0A4Q9V3H3_9ACTO|nr:MDR family oxidoreductase [Arcanobacterium bovis]TBW23672.1 oxidoreductase [Arcanobacterium bovis]
MQHSTFKAWIVRKDAGHAQASFESFDESFLLAGSPCVNKGDDAVSRLLGGTEPRVVLRVKYSSINYKDALALEGKPGIIRQYPLIPGIDLVGEVVESSDSHWKPGVTVVLTGAGIGEEKHGGLSELACVSTDALIALPEVFSAKQAAAIGTAGYTAALCVMALQDAGIDKDKGPILVTGAGGGVGSIAVALLAGHGYEVHAVTGRKETLTPQLTMLGASQILSREEVNTNGKPLVKQRWAGAVDTVGGDILASVLAAIEHNGAVAACGLAGGAQLSCTVMPFILRGVNLLGVNSVLVDYERRLAAWELLGRALDTSLLDAVTSEVELADVRSVTRELLAGNGTGRTVVHVS